MTAKKKLSKRISYRVGIQIKNIGREPITIEKLRRYLTWFERAHVIKPKDAIFLSSREDEDEQN